MEARAEVVEAIMHSVQNGKFNLGDAQDELQQKYGFDLEWEQRLIYEKAKRLRRRQSHKKKVSSDEATKQILQGIEPRIPKQEDLTPSKRSAAGQDQDSTDLKVPKKVKKEPALVLSKAPSENEKEQVLPERKDANKQADIIFEDDSSTGSDQGVPALLDLNGFKDDNEEGSDLSSEDNFSRELL